MDRRQHLVTLMTAGLAAFLWKPTLRADEKPALGLTPASEKKPKQSLIEISKETTYFTEPLDDEGYVDLIAAVDNLLGEGVSPEDNASVLLWQAIGPRCEKKVQKAYFAKLGMKVPPEHAEYFEEFLGYFVHNLPHDKWDQAKEQFAASHRGPWSGEKLFFVEKWLKMNEAPLKLASAAARRPKCFDAFVPVLTSKGLRSGDNFVHILRRDDISEALLSRAMLRAHDGDVDTTLEDLITICRLAQHTDNALAGIAWATAVNMEEHAQRGFANIACETKWMTGEYRRCLKEIRALPPLAPVHVPFDTFERFYFIDCIQELARGRKVEDLELPEKYLEELFAAGIDWNETLRHGRGYLDRRVAALKEPSGARHDLLMAKATAELQELYDLAENDFRSAELRTYAGPDRRKFASHALSELLIWRLSPAFSHYRDLERRHQQRWELTHIALALAAYRAEHGAYPRTLEALVPEYFKEITPDRFSKNPLRYEGDDDGFMLYSVGENGKDNGGFGVDDESDDGVLRDDLVIRTPKK